MDDPENEISLAAVEPNLTIATIILCLLGPFWLIYRLVKRLLKTSSIVPDRIERATE